MPSPGKSVLVVEDLEGVRKVLARSLEVAGYRVLDAKDSAGALRLLQTFQVDLVVTDHDLGKGKSGRELAEAVKGERRSAAVLMMTARPTTGLQAWAQANGVALLLKPFSPVELLERAHAALERRQETPTKSG